MLKLERSDYLREAIAAGFLAASLVHSADEVVEETNW